MTPAEEAKHKNIIDMALGFSAMMRLFTAGSAQPIKDHLEQTLEALPSIESDDDFSSMHDNFCRWFVQNIKLAKKSEPSSYGHAAKILDLALKVYVYYCKMPNPELAEMLIPRLNAAIDGPILRHLLRIVENKYKKS